jgi:hypothetical protein
MTTQTPDPDDDRLGDALRASRLLIDAPEALIQRTVALFQASARPAASAPLPRWRAVLQFDSGLASPLAFGMRSATAEVRQLLYSLQGCDVDLRVARDDSGGDNGFSLSGQLLGPDSQGVVVAERGSADDGSGADQPAPLLRAALNELGEFRLPPLAAGAWRLSVELADKTIELPPLQLGAADGPHP